MLSLRSQVMESSFAEWSTWSPAGKFVSGHLLTILTKHCGSSRMPHTCREAAASKSNPSMTKYIAMQRPVLFHWSFGQVGSSVLYVCIL